MDVNPVPTPPPPQPPPGARNAARSAATRARLIAAGRELFAMRGFAEVSTEEIVRAAGVTRGALYHHFDDKVDLFRAVYEQVEADVTARVARDSEVSESPWDILERGAQLFLDACAEPEVQRIALVDAPAVLGWEGWREVADRYALALVEALIAQAVQQEEIDPQPPRTLALLLIGAIDEAALLVARAADFDAARTEVGDLITWLLDSLRRR